MTDRECPHVSCHHSFDLPIRLETHLVAKHDAFANAGSTPGPLSDIGVCDDESCPCGGPA